MNTLKINNVGIYASMVCEGHVTVLIDRPSTDFSPFFKSLILHERLTRFLLVQISSRVPVSATLFMIQVSDESEFSEVGGLSYLVNKKIQTILRFPLFLESFVFLSAVSLRPLPVSPRIVY